MVIALRLALLSALMASGSARAEVDVHAAGTIGDPVVDMESAKLSGRWPR